ncbi:hypothetical protein EV426DRAFT_715314 [Tirmania nivea]|nr:hypothetical protein EV426DRAFT_715314 [Tirmania nivea]
MSNPKPEEKTYMAWSKDDVERLVGWMEENQEALRGQQKKWHKDIKEEVFADEVTSGASEVEMLSSVCSLLDEG